MTEKELWLCRGKTVKAILKNGHILEGFCSIFTSAYDNDPEIPSITLDMPYGMVEITEPEIERIEVLK